MSSATHPYDHFNPRAYLEEYYATVPPENLELLRFLTGAFADLPSGALALDFGAGPTVFSAIAGAHRVREMHLCEFLPANRHEVSRWLAADPDAFDWGETVRAALRLDGLPDTPDLVREREAIIRQRVTAVMPCDLLRDFPLDDPAARERYDVVVSNLCAEAAAPNHEVWRACVARIASLVRPGGRLVMSAVRQSKAYSVGDSVFHVLPIDTDDLRGALAAAGLTDITLSVTDADHPVHSYDGLMFATAQKP